MAWLDRAFELAERGRQTVSPNPLVGCVLVRDDTIVGEGWHEHAGGPHAEIVALGAAGQDARGATAYVTLEPCNHHGRTPPCTEALIAAGVVRVVAALADPHPLASGGADRLRAAGVTVDLDVAPERARRQNAVFLHGIATGRPFVTLKLAPSLDGRLAAADGTARWLTGPAARAHAHALRGDVDAVVVGSGTVLADDPALTVRDLPVQSPRQPLRVVLDRRGRLADPQLRAQLRTFDAAAPTVVLDTPDPKATLSALWERDVRSVLIEGGGTVAGAFLHAGLVDRLIVHLAAVILGEGGVPAVSGVWIETLTAAPRFALEGVEQLGDDLVVTYTPRWGASPPTPPHPEA